MCNVFELALVVSVSYFVSCFLEYRSEILIPRATFLHRNGWQIPVAETHLKLAPLKFPFEDSGSLNKYRLLDSSGGTCSGLD